MLVAVHCGFHHNFLHLFPVFFSLFRVCYQFRSLQLFPLFFFIWLNFMLKILQTFFEVWLIFFVCMWKMDIDILIPKMQMFPIKKFANRTEISTSSWFPSGQFDLMSAILFWITMYSWCYCFFYLSRYWLQMRATVLFCFCIFHSNRMSNFILVHLYELCAYIYFDGIWISCELYIVYIVLPTAIDSIQ